MKLGDICQLVRGNTYKSSLLSETEGPVLLGLGSIEKDGGFKRGSRKHYPGKSDSRIILHPGDLYVSLKDLTQECGLLGAISRVPADLSEGRLTQDTVKLELDSSIGEEGKLYVYWSLRTPQYRKYCRARGTGTTNMSLSRTDFLNWEIPPVSPTRSNLISTFELIDAKTEANAKLNGYLEEWGQGLLEKYQESCATTIPLSNVMDFGNGYAFKSGAYIQDGLYKVLTIKNVQDGSVDCSMSNRIDELPPKMKPFCKLQPGDVVLSLTGNVGRVGIVPEENCLLNQRVAVLQPYNYALLPGLYFHFRQKAFQNKMIGIAKGTAQANLSPVETLKLEMPYNESFFEISQKLKPAFDLILANTIESKRLAVLRDALLPKLMSGEIDVSKIDLTQPNSHLA